MDILMARNLGGLRPIDEAGEEMLRKITMNRTVKVVVTQPRNLNHHRLFFALLNKVYDNLPETAEIPNVEALLGALKLATGHYDVCVSSNGQEFRIPKSINFASMDQGQFNEFFNRCCDVICKHFLPGVTSAQLHAEVAEMTGAADHVAVELASTERGAGG